MKRIFFAIALTATIGLSGCAGTDNRSFTGLKTKPAESRLGSVILLVEGPCPSEPIDSSFNIVGATVLPVIASFGAQFSVDAISEAIKEYKGGLTGFFTASAQYKTSSLVSASCLVVARGLIGTRTKAASASAQWDPSMLTDDSGETIFADYPAFYLEARILGVPDNLALVPIYLDYAASGARSRGSGKKFVSVAIGVSDSTPKRDSDSSTIVTKDNSIAATFLDFGRLEIGKRYDVATLKGTDAQSAMKLLGTAQRIAVTAVVTDSEEPGVGFKAFESAYNSNKASLKTALETVFKNALGVSDDKK